MTTRKLLIHEKRRDSLSPALVTVHALNPERFNGLALPDYFTFAATGLRLMTGRLFRLASHVVKIRASGLAIKTVL